MIHYHARVKRAIKVDLSLYIAKKAQLHRQRMSSANYYKKYYEISEKGCEQCKSLTIKNLLLTTMIDQLTI